MGRENREQSPWLNFDGGFVADCFNEKHTRESRLIRGSYYGTNIFVSARLLPAVAYYLIVYCILLPFSVYLVSYFIVSRLVSRAARGNFRQLGVSPRASISVTRYC